jgi:hypothetical protein
MDLLVTTFNHVFHEEAFFLSLLTRVILYTLNHNFVLVYSFYQDKKRTMSDLPVQGNMNKIYYKRNQGNITVNCSNPKSIFLYNIGCLSNL